MGLEAYVRCRCWSSERPPEPEALRGLIELDNGVPTLSLDYVGNEALYRQLHDYVRSFCPHEDMYLVTERIGSWGYVGAFITLLREVDAQRFSTLINVFPEANEGEVDPAVLSRLLFELDQFDALGMMGRRLVLVLEDGDVEVCSAGTEQDRVIAVGPNQQQGLNLRGFYVRRDGEIVFRSSHFEQILQWPVGARAPVAQFRAIDSDQVCDSAIAIPSGFSTDDAGDTVVGYGNRFLLRIATQQSSDHSLTSNSLRLLFKAALETGNPVCWT